MPQIIEKASPELAKQNPGVPRLVNRGPGGLLVKLSPEQKQEVKVHPLPEVQINKIAEPLLAHAVPIDSVVPDAMNARLHPERNMEAIRASLTLFGQVKPIVVRKENSSVMAGNGTLQAAKDLGWTEIAAIFIDMTEAEAANYGVTDNRTAELAKWDYQVIAAIDKQCEEAGISLVGWSTDELSVLRVAEWTPPASTGEAPFQGSGAGSEGTGSGSTTEQGLVISFTPDEYVIIENAIARVREREPGKEIDRVECIRRICIEWLGLLKSPEPTGEASAEDRPAKPVPKPKAGPAPKAARTGK